MTAENKLRVNREITSHQVRLISKDGEMIGILKLADALYKAKEFNLDLVEISPNVIPPVCKIADYGKIKYQIQKKKNDNKKKQKTIDVKEVKLSLNIGKNDYDIKINKIIKFLQNNHKVKVTINIRGRELFHSDLAYNMIKDIRDDISEYGKFDAEPNIERRQITILIIAK